MSSPPAQALTLFYSYSHSDAELREELNKHLANLKNQGLIAEWSDREIPAGDEWDRRISEQLDNAQVILLLVSADFLASKYCNEKELKRAMERHEAGEARVIPIILRPCDWHAAPFAKLQGLPKDGRPVTLWRSHDEAFTDVAKAIREVVEESTQSPPA